MILDSIYKYGKTIKELAPHHFEYINADWILNIQENGEYQFISNNNKNTHIFAKNIINRSGTKIRPKLLGDKTNYMFLNINNKKNSNISKFDKNKVYSFLDLVLDCFNDTNIKYLKLIYEILKNNNIVFPDDLNKNDWIKIYYNGRDPLQNKKIIKYWQNKQNNIAEKRSKFESTCMICGKKKTIADRHPVKIKLPGGHQSGSNVVSANQRAYESYGLSNSFNTPICFKCSETYGKTINYLLKNNKTKSQRMIIGKDIYLYWSKENLKIDIFDLLKKPDYRKITKLKKHLNNNKDKSKKVNILALKANQSRVVIDNFISINYNKLLINIYKYYKVMTFNNTYKYYGINTLLVSLSDDFKSISTKTSNTLLQYILKHKPINEFLLHKIINKIKNEKTIKITGPRITLLNLFLKSNNINIKNDSNIYLSGKLFGLLNKIERISKEKNKLLDNYWNIILSSPNNILTKLTNRAKFSLNSLKSNHFKKVIYRKLKNELIELRMKISNFPNKLNLIEQGIFIIGFYQEEQSQFKKEIG